MFDFPYSTFIGIIVASMILLSILYCVRFKYIHRNIATHPMQVVVIPQSPPHHELQYPQTCYSISVEQPPPPYNAVVAGMNTNYNNRM
jgi:hypothetical protein